MSIIMIHNLVQENGKTIKENNLEKMHKIPIGSLVEIEGSKERLYVCQQIRDCDGTPLYALCMRSDLGWFGTERKYIDDDEDATEVVDPNLLNHHFDDLHRRQASSWTQGYCFESLTVVK